MKSKTELDDIVSNLCNKFSDHHLGTWELVYVLAHLLYSIGSSLEQCDDSLSAEQVLLRYAKDATLGSALMAQAILMKETWLKEREETTDGTTDKIIQGKTERAETTAIV